MNVYNLLKTLELSIPVIIDGKIWRMIDGNLQCGVSINGEPAYIGIHNDLFAHLAQQLDEADEINLTMQRISIKEKGLPDQLDYEREFFNELGCNIPNDTYLQF